MLILDISNIKKRPSVWPKSMPNKIRVLEGRYFADYDIHPEERRKRWYKELVKNMKEIKPQGNFSIPIGINKDTMDSNAKIIDV